MTEPTLDLLAADQRRLVDLARLERPTIKILLYTDAPNDVVKERVGDFGLGQMIALLEAHSPAFANLCVKWESRYPKGSTKAENKIHVVLRKEEATGQPFDQIWFFGLHQVNKSSVYLGLNGGGPESELDGDEVQALRAWMDKGGGVLMTGDHANLRPTDALDPDPNPPCPYRFGNDKYAGLGRALGRCVPRAGELRDWDGSPTSREDDSNNTQVTLFALCRAQFSDQILFQTDEKPQQLILATFNEKGELKLGGNPHPLFLYRDDCGPIQFFPDHLHEGRVIIPDSFPETVWKKNARTEIQPLPRVVAYGLDKRSGNKFDLIAAYDGSVADVGRIVADSTWHHYFNVNLAGFVQPTAPDCALNGTGPGSAIDQIGQFYGNLALWLTPATTRFRMAEAMFRWLAQHPRVLEELVPRPEASIEDKMRAGVASRRLLLRVSSPCEIHELLNLTIPASYVESFETLYLPERGYNLSVFPSQEVLLGSVVNQYPRDLLNDSGDSLARVERLGKIRAAFNAGAEDAFDAQVSTALETAASAQKFLGKARLRASTFAEEDKTWEGSDAFGNEQSAERNNDMSVCATPGWAIELIKQDSDSSSTRFSFINMAVNGEVLTGTVIDISNGNTTPLSGTCRPVGGTTTPPNLSRMSFEFRARASDRSLVTISIFGHGFTVPNSQPPKGVFRGRYDAVAAQVEFADDTQVALAVDPGETGTGNGNQT